MTYCLYDEYPEAHLGVISPDQDRRSQQMLPQLTFHATTLLGPASIYS